MDRIDDKACTHKNDKIKKKQEKAKTKAKDKEKVNTQKY